MPEQGSLKRTASFSSEEEDHKKGHLPGSVETVMAPSAIEAAVLAPNGHTNGMDDTSSDTRDVLVVGAGPAGLMLAMNLARHGVDVQVVDDRTSKTSTGRADGLQPKSIETLKQLRLADDLLKKGVKIYDIAFWNSTTTSPMQRTGRADHYPERLVGECLDPYILLVHQGMVEDIFLNDLKDHGVEVTRSSPFVSCTPSMKGLLESTCEDSINGGTRTIKSKYVVGCDGAHSKVRRSISGIDMNGESGKSAWGVLDGVIETDFPDIWTKAIIHSEGYGSILIIPRERNMTRLYIELHPGTTQPISSEVANQDFVMSRAKEILRPFTLEWKSIEWFSVYRVGQRVASKFMNPTENIFISGDASHTHSPKAAQGMNTSMHDTFNLAWKLNLTIRGLALPSLLQSYELERMQIARQLIEFDYEHANAFSKGDAEALAKNFDDNIRFISGIGAEYRENVLNFPEIGGEGKGLLRAGALLPPTKLTRFIDANPVHGQLDIPMLSQFRIYFFVSSVKASLPFLKALSHNIRSSNSVLGRATKSAEISYARMAPNPTNMDEYVQPGRYTAVSKIFTPAIITSEDKSGVEIAYLPSLWRHSPWTVYIDDVIPGQTLCTTNWLGGLEADEVAIVNVRPDGYVGTVGRFSLEQSETAQRWLDSYYGGFLKG